MKHERFTGLERRGRVYYLQVRVPSEFADVEPRVEINRSLKTRDRAEAESRCAMAKAALLRDWRARKIRRQAPNAREAFDASIELLSDWGLKHRPMQELIEGPIEDLLQRMELVMRSRHDSAILPVALDAVDLPKILLSEMPPAMEKLRTKDAAAKNERQLREWRAKYERAASCFKELVSDKHVLEITEADALVCFEHWKKVHAESVVTANYAAKQLRFMRQMIDGCYRMLRVPKSQQSNAFADLKIEKFRYDIAEHDTTKLPLTVAWIRQTIIDESKMPDLNGQARDITIIAADSGTRQSEIYDLPETDIFLDHHIPHILLRVVTEGEQKRQIKNLGSTRPVVLLGVSLEAMRRNPQGFPRYRGKASYSATVTSTFGTTTCSPPCRKPRRGNTRSAARGIRSRTV